jgi:hypothetical protein
MEDAQKPTIKGIFVKSHIRALEHERGTDGVAELERRFGKSVSFASNDDVPVSDEVEILEHIVDITSPALLSREERELEAGRLHFRNFATTAVWLLIQQIFGTNLKFLLMQSSKIAGWVFRGIEFVSEDVGPTSVKITMFNNDYPLEHFQGFIEQWLRYSRVQGIVEATAHTRGRYENLI